MKGEGYARVGILRPGYSQRNYSDWQALDFEEWISLEHEVTKDEREGEDGVFRIQHTSCSEEAEADDENSEIDEVDLLVGAAWVSTGESPGDVEDWD